MSIQWVLRASTLAVVGLALAACSGPSDRSASSVDPKYGVSASPRVVDKSKPIPKGGGHYKVGKPYKVAGKTYVPREQPGYDAVGMASWYGDAFHGRLTANGEVYDMHTFSAAHPTLPLPSYVRVTNLENRRSVVVRVNDRGPYAHDRVIDLSKRTAKVLDFHGRGLTKVRVQYVGPAPLEGDDTAWLTTTARVEDGAMPSTLMAATLPPAQTATAFADAGLVPRVGLGAQTPRTRRGFGLLSGFVAQDLTGETVESAFAAFETQTDLSLPAAFTSVGKR